MQQGLMEYLDASVVGNSGSGDKLKTWLEEGGVTSLSGGMMTMTNLAPSDPPTAPPTTNGPEEGDFTRMLLGSLSLGSSDDFSLPPRAYHQNPTPMPTNPYDLPLLQAQTPFQLPSQHQLPSHTQTLPPPPPMFNVPRDIPLEQQLQFQLEHLRAAQQQHNQEHQRVLQQTQVYQQQPQSEPQLRPSTRDSPNMMYMTPLQPIMLPSFGGYYANLTPAPAQPTFSRIPYMNMEQQLPLHPVPIQPAPARPSIDYKECTFAHFSPKGEEPAEISPNANLGSSVNDKGEGGTVAPLEILYQPFYQPDYSDDDLDFGSGGSFDAGDGRRDSARKVKGEKGREKGSSDSEWESEGEGEERPTFPFILKLATKRREEEHMRFGFALDPHVRGKSIQLTIKEEILQRPPRKEKTSSKNKNKGTDSDAGNGGGSGRGRGRATGKKAKVKESAKEDPHILFRGRLESGTSGTAEMRASSVHGLMTPLHWVLDRQELTLNFKAAEGSGMNIIRYQFHVQPVDTSPSPTEQQYINDPTRPARYVAMSVPAIICSHSTSQFQRALLALIHYHFHNQDRVASEDILACFELLAGSSFKQFKEAFATFPLPAGSPVLRGTDVPAVLEWFLASWRIFSVDNYMALYKLGYVHGFLGRDQAQDLLKFQEEGVFLIRIGSNGLSMSIKYGGQIMPVEIDPNTLKQISITVAADSAVRLLCRDGSKLPKDTLIQAITAIPRFGYASVARLASLAKERQENSTDDGRNGEEGEHKRKR